ncbi:5147_t:CDS:2, partial [Funneliformis geosporum]
MELEVFLKNLKLVIIVVKDSLKNEKVLETIIESLENVQSEWHFHVNSSKDLINEIVELIEDADEYRWIYNRQYKSKESITYWYSQRDTLSKKPRKNADISKQKDIPSMERFEC